MNQHSIKQNIFDFQLCNNLGKMEPNYPLTIFGPTPRIKSYFIIGCVEWWDKSITDISIQIYWEKKALPKDFSKYFEAYNKNLKNEDFKVTFNILKNGIWESFTEKSYSLFEENIEDNTISPGSTFNLNLIKI